MAIVKCSQEHFFDNDKYSKCPHCKEDISREDEPVTVPLEQVGHKIQNEDLKTIKLFPGKTKTDPVTGWLVCTEGPEKGRDYRIYSEKNFVGRSLDMDITIVDDVEISREKHCTIIFNPQDLRFYLVPGEGTVTYLNQNSLLSAQELTDSDVIRIGKSSFTFVPFCKGERKWS